MFSQEQDIGYQDVNPSAIAAETYRFSPNLTYITYKSERDDLEFKVTSTESKDILNFSLLFGRGITAVQIYSYGLLGGSDVPVPLYDERTLASENSLDARSENIWNVYRLFHGFVMAKTNGMSVEDYADILMKLSTKIFGEQLYYVICNK